MITNNSLFVASSWFSPLSTYEFCVCDCNHRMYAIKLQRFPYNLAPCKTLVSVVNLLYGGKTKHQIYDGWNFNSGNYLFTTGTK